MADLRLFHRRRKLACTSIWSSWLLLILFPGWPPWLRAAAQSLDFGCGKSGDEDFSDTELQAQGVRLAVCRS